MTGMNANGNRPARILVVDDEPSIVDAVATALRYEGFEVREEASGRAAISAVVQFDPDLVVLDWMLPDVEGIEVGRRLRERGFKTAILFLTAKDAVENKVEALRAGGDDYVTKPFSLAEVVARVQAILRRTGSDLPGDVLSFADVTLDEVRHEVFRGETRVDLTATEFSLLRFFMLNPRRVLSKGQILQNVWRYDFAGTSSVVETYVSYLRKKLDSARAPADPDGPAGGLHARSRGVGARPALAARAAGHRRLRHRRRRPRRRRRRHLHVAPLVPPRPRRQLARGGPRPGRAHRLRRRRASARRAAAPRPTPRRPAAQGIDWYQVGPLAAGSSGGFLVGGGSPPKLPAQIDVRFPAAAAETASTSPTSRSRPGRSTSYRVRASIDPRRPNSSC